MTIVFQTIDEKVVTWRTLWPARELVRRGHQVQVYATAAGIPPPEGDPGSDVTYVFHIINRAWGYRGGTLALSFLDIAEMLKQDGRLILTFDDDWSQMLHVQPKPIDPGARIVHAQLPELTRMADRVIVATPRLKEVFGKWNDDVRIVPNTVPEWVLNLPRAPRLERIAWMGEMYIHGTDWNLLAPYAKDLPPLRLVCSGERAAERLRSWGARDVEATDPMYDQRKLYTEIGQAVAAIIPLADTPFNRGKSWSKPMEFMARGVQPLASRHAEYDRLHGLTGALPTFDTPEGLVEAVNEAWENRPDGDCLPDRLRDANLTMETGGGDAWEKALV